MSSSSPSQLTPSSPSPAPPSLAGTTLTPSIASGSLPSSAAPTTASTQNTSSSSTAPQTATTSTAQGTLSDFPLPPHAQFPPFYTLQPVERTRNSQLASWASLILSFAEHAHLFRIGPSHPVFANTRLRRRLAPQDARLVLAHMVQRGAAQWVGRREGAAPTPSSSSAATSSGWTGSAAAQQLPADEAAEVHLWWRSPESWGSAMAEYAASAGQRGAVLTLYELVASGDGPAATQPFHGLPFDMARAAVGLLAKRGKASVFGEGDGVGVKFYF